MRKIKKLIEKLKLLEPVQHGDDDFAMIIFSEFSVNGIELSKEYPFNVPTDLVEFWKEVETAKLFYDRTFGQWGLEILKPDDALFLTNEQKNIRSKDYLHSDLIIGKFIGDSDLLVISCNKQDKFGEIIVANPIDSRNEWSTVSRSFLDFLTEYILQKGDKYWE